MNKRIKIFEIIIIVLMSILIIYLFYIQVIKRRYYLIKLKELVNIKIEGSTAPRGKIYDRNGKLLVDNKMIRTLYYYKGKNKLEDELKISKLLSEILDIDNKGTIDTYKNYWIVINKELSNKKITDEEYKLKKYRKLNNNDLYKLKMSRITKEEINSLSESDKKIAYIYELMNKGIKYEDKIIKKYLTDSELEKLKKLNINSLIIKNDWERDYKYNDTFKSMFGSVSNIQSNNKEYYIGKGYSLNDRVGTSYLEFEYDDYLRGVKDKYIVNNNKKVLKEKGSSGNDIYLTIDIDLQSDIESILEEEMIKTKREKNTDYYNKSFVIITNPKTGEIISMTGKQVIEDSKSFKIYDYTPAILTSPITAGSVVKGASHIVGYNTGALKIGENRLDKCVKLKGAPKKCSWMSLGYLNDITALKKSSNTYQYQTAIKVSNNKYYYNMSFKPTKESFNIYRNTLKEFGLGSKTGIDLPLESTGIKGSKDEGGLLLDLAIGQYDTYTPLELSQYIGTIANNGTRMQLHLLKKVISSKNKNLIHEYKNTILNQVNTEYKYLSRVQEGFREVLKIGGTGSGYIDLKYKPAGKTGTSQSFIDTNQDGMIDKETITTTFVGYAPYDDPAITFTVVSPDISNYDHKSNYQSNLNARLMRRISKLYFEKYQKSV